MAEKNTRGSQSPYYGRMKRSGMAMDCSLVGARRLKRFGGGRIQSISQRAIKESLETPPR